MGGCFVCVLSIVDNRRYRRLIYEVLDHDPTHEDIIRFFRRFQRELKTRGLDLSGITTDGSALYPVPIAKVFGEDMPHQVCEFHVIKELNKAILHAVAKERKRLKATLPTFPCIAPCLPATTKHHLLYSKAAKITREPSPGKWIPVVEPRKPYGPISCPPVTKNHCSPFWAPYASCRPSALNAMRPSNTRSYGSPACPSTTTDLR